MKKVIFLLATTLVFLGLNGIISNAEEHSNSLVESIVENEKSNDSVLDLSIKLIDTEKKLLNIYKEKEKLENISYNDFNYLEFLNEISMANSLDIGINAEENSEFSEFSTIYINRIASFVPNDLTSEDILEIEKQRDILLNKTYQDIKDENMSLFFELENNQQTLSRSSRAAISEGSFNIQSASYYAKQYAEKPNTNYRYFGNGDCTNFASQIVKHAGKKMNYYKNNSGLTWYYTNGTASAPAWRLAHQFLVYWSADYNVTYSCATKSDVKSRAIEGDFIAYWKKGTYEIGHISYVNAKKNGKINVSQHSTNRYNYSFDTQDTSAYSSFIVLRIR